MRVILSLVLRGRRVYFVVELEEGPLGDSLHRAIGRLFAQGWLAGFSAVQGVAHLTTQLQPSDEVAPGGIVRAGRTLVASDDQPPTLDISCGSAGPPAPSDPEEELLVKAKAPRTLPRSGALLRLTMEEDEEPLVALLMRDTWRLRRSTPAPRLVLPPNALPDLGEHELPEDEGPYRLVMHQGMHQSGDRHSIALSLQIIPWLELNVCFDDRYYPHHYELQGLPVTTAVRQKGERNADEMIDFYLGCGIDPIRIRKVKTTDVEKAVSRKHQPPGVLFASDATRIVASCLDLMGFSDFVHQVATPTFIGNLSPERRLVAARTVEALTRGVEDDDRPVVLIYLRNSGSQPGGAHPELDTRKAMIGQIVEYLSAQSPPPHIFLVGDGIFKHLSYSTPPPTGKAWKASVRSMVQWWDYPTTHHQLPRLTRHEQLFGLHHLHGRLRNRLTILGMRSGMLEAPAFLGIPTVYIDYPNSAGFDRMLILAGDARGGIYKGSGDSSAFGGTRLPSYHVFVPRPVDTLSKLLPANPSDSKKRGDALRRARHLLKTASAEGKTKLKELVDACGGKHPALGKLLPAFAKVTSVHCSDEADLEQRDWLLLLVRTYLEDSDICIDPLQLPDLKRIIYSRMRDPSAPSLVPRRGAALFESVMGLLEPSISDLPGMKDVRELVKKVCALFRACDPKKLPKPKEGRSLGKPTGSVLPHDLAQQFTLHGNAGEGDCLFLALAQALSRPGEEGLVRQFASLLRKRIVGFMATHFSAQDWWGSMRIKLSYLEYIGQPGAWAGDFEIAALSLALGVTIVVHSVQHEAPLRYNEGAPRTIQIYHNGAHYEWLAPRKN